jgi:hypothetical protein
VEKALGTNDNVQDLTDEEGRTLFDNASRFYLGISGDEFVGRWESGYYDEDPDQPDVVDVAMLLPFAR